MGAGRFRARFRLAGGVLLTVYVVSPCTSSNKPASTPRGTSGTSYPLLISTREMFSGTSTCP